MSDLTISWEYTSGNKPDIIYYLNGSNVGINDIGFELILEQLRTKKPEKVFIHMSEVYQLDSGSLESHLPFYKRINEFNHALDGKELVYNSV